MVRQLGSESSVPGSIPGGRQCFYFYTRNEMKLFFTRFSLSITLESLFTLILHFTSLLENCIFQLLGHWIGQSEFKPRLGKIYFLFHPIYDMKHFCSKCALKITLVYLFTLIFSYLLTCPDWIFTITVKIQFSERLVTCKMKVNKDTEVIDRENLEKIVLYNL